MTYDRQRDNMEVGKKSMRNISLDQQFEGLLAVPYFLNLGIFLGNHSYVHEHIGKNCNLFKSKQSEAHCVCSVQKLQTCHLPSM